MTNVFCVRAEFGQYSLAFLQGGYVAIGWLAETDLRDIGAIDYEKLRDIYTHFHPTDSPISIGQNVGQIARFLFEIQPGDIVVTPTLESEKLAVGKVTSQYYYETDPACPYPHRKKVEWYDGLVLRTTLSIPLQNTLRSLLAVYRVNRGDEIARAVGIPVPETQVMHAEADLHR